MEANVKKSLIDIINVNMGLESYAKYYLETQISDNSKSVVYSRTGPLKEINLYRHKLKNGTYAEEFLQYFAESNYGQTIFFIGLHTHKKDIVWPSKKIIKVLKEKH